MSIKQALNLSAKKLNKAKIENPHLDAELLLSHILNKSREYLLTHNDQKINFWQKFKFDKFISKRCKGVPVAYLVGHKHFYGLDFIVNKNVLVPRPETELMVEFIMEHGTKSIEHSTIIDIGTGSGCIAISLVKNSNLECFATDISQKALKVAKKNTKKHGVEDKITFLQGNLLEPFLNNPKYLNNLNGPLLIAANLPYGWKDWKNNYCSMETIGLKFEPEIALFTEENGLKLYRQLFEQIKKIQNMFHVPCSMFCEIDPRQVSLMSELIKEELPQAIFETKKDLADLDRLVIIKIK